MIMTANITAEDLHRKPRPPRYERADEIDASNVMTLLYIQYSQMTPPAVNKPPTRRRASPPSAKERLIEIATEIVGEAGVQALTLDAVAARAGITRGGLIYHFKTKDELLGALVERLIVQIESRNLKRASKVAADQGQSAGGTRELLRAWATDTFAMKPAERQVISNLLSAATAFPQHLTPVQGLFARLYGEFAKDEAAAPKAMVVGAALDGFLLLELLGLHRFSKRERDALRSGLQTMLDSMDNTETAR